MARLHYRMLSQSSREIQTPIFPAQSTNAQLWYRFRFVEWNISKHVEEMLLVNAESKSVPAEHQAS